MYTEFFNLQRPPFNSTLDSSFYFESPQHAEALAALIYAVQERKGMVVVTGDVGSGKSLIGRMLIESLESADVALISDTHVGGEDLLAAACRQFQLPMDPAFNTMELLATLEEFLLTEHAKDRAAVLIIDDAHLLEDRHLQQLRLMANLEVAGGKLLQIVLLGQRDLHQQLHGPGTKALRQRVFRSLHLSALSRDLTAGYVRHRINAVRGNGAGLFDDDALDMVHKYSGGVPRLINNLCDNVLLSAYSDDVRQVDGARVAAVIDEITSTAHSGGERMSTGGSDDVDHAIEEITQRYVRSLESQISALDSAGAESDRRIQELSRLTARLKAQEDKLCEYEKTCERRSRDLQKLAVTLQEQERSLADREQSIGRRLEDVEAAAARLDGQEQALIEREARMAQQHRELQRLSQTVIEQDRQLTERASFIEQKLANRQVAFDRELNECKRAVNRKWQDMKQLVVEHVSREAESSKRLAAVDCRLKRFESLEPDLARIETRLLTTSTNVLAEMNHKVNEFSATLGQQEARIYGLRSGMEADLGRIESQLTAARDSGQCAVDAAVASRNELRDAIEQAARAYGNIRGEVEQVVGNARKLLDQPAEILERASRQLEQVERMAGMVQKATASLQKSIDGSGATARELHEAARETRDALEETTEDAAQMLNDLADQTHKTRQLRDVFREIFDRAEAQINRLKRVQTETEAAMAKVLRQSNSLRESVDHPTRLVQELRAVGSAAERNIHEGVTKLTELKSMIDKADRARKSIEALIQATRRVAEARRGPGATDRPVTPRRGSVLTDKLAALQASGPVMRSQHDTAPLRAITEVGAGPDGADH